MDYKEPGKWTEPAGLTSFTYGKGGSTQPKSILNVLSQGTGGLSHWHQLKVLIVQPISETHLERAIIPGHLMAEFEEHYKIHGTAILMEEELVLGVDDDCC